MDLLVLTLYLSLLCIALDTDPLLTNQTISVSLVRGEMPQIMVMLSSLRTGCMMDILTSGG